MWPALGGSLRSWATTSRRVRLRSGGDRHGSPVLADAIYQNLNIVADDHLDYILVLGADHIYRMDPRQMLARHIETRAPATLVAVGVPAVEAGSFGWSNPAKVPRLSVSQRSRRTRWPWPTGETSSTPQWALRVEA